MFQEHDGGVSESKEGGDGRPAKSRSSRSRGPKPAGEASTSPKRRRRAAKPAADAIASPKPRSRRKSPVTPALPEAAVPRPKALPVAPPQSRDVPAAAARQVAQPLDARLLIGGDIGCLVVTAALAADVALGGDGPVRLLLALAFTSVVPGWALVRWFRLADSATGAAMAVPCSLAICAAASAIMVWLNAWQPLVLLAALAIVSAGVIGWMLRVQLDGRRAANEALARW